MGMDNISSEKQKAFAHTIPSKAKKQKKKSRGDVVHVSSGADIQRRATNSGFAPQDRRQNFKYAYKNCKEESSS